MSGVFQQKYGNTEIGLHAIQFSSTTLAIAQRSNGIPVLFRDFMKPEKMSFKY